MEGFPSHMQTTAATVTGGTENEFGSGPSAQPAGCRAGCPAPPGRTR
jgi:hypothetical protein